MRDKKLQSRNFLGFCNVNKAAYTALVAPSGPKSESVTDQRTDGPTNQRTNGRTDGRTRPLIDMGGRI